MKTSRTSLAVWAAAAILAAGLAGCGSSSPVDNNNNDGPISADLLAINQINEQTCNMAFPMETNPLTITDNFDEVDLSRLTPACSSGT